MIAATPLDLLTELFTDLRQVQIQLARWLPVLAGRVNHRGVRHLIGKHASESARHLGQLDQFFHLHGVRPVEGTSKAVKLIIDDSDDNIPDVNDPDRSDLILILQILRVEQFEITSYEIVARVAEQLGFPDDTHMLLEFLAERDASTSILRDLQSDIIRNAFPTATRPESIFPE